MRILMKILKYFLFFILWAVLSSIIELFSLAGSSIEVFSSHDSLSLFSMILGALILILFLIIGKRLSRSFGIDRYFADAQNKAAIQHERSLMTPKLRYQVLRRDGFRCCICGASSRDGVKLHVDHIKPVSKGGKTEIRNLRTLCDRCNLGKGSSYIEGGIN